MYISVAEVIIEYYFGNLSQHCKFRFDIIHVLHVKHINRAEAPELDRVLANRNCQKKKSTFLHVSYWHAAWMGARESEKCEIRRWMYDCANVKERDREEYCRNLYSKVKFCKNSRCIITVSTTSSVVLLNLHLSLFDIRHNVRNTRLEGNDGVF